MCLQQQVHYGLHYTRKKNGNMHDPCQSKQDSGMATDTHVQFYIQCRQAGIRPSIQPSNEEKRTKGNVVFDILPK